MALSPSSWAISASWRDRICDTRGFAFASKSCRKSLLASRTLSVPPEEEVGDQSNSGQRDEDEHPGQRRLRAPVLRDQEDPGCDRVKRERGGQDRADVVQNDALPQQVPNAALFTAQIRDEERGCSNDDPPSSVSPSQAALWR